MTVTLWFNPVAIGTIIALFLLGTIGFWFASYGFLDGGKWVRWLVSLMWPVVLCVVGLAVLITGILWPDDLKGLDQGRE